MDRRRYYYGKEERGPEDVVSAELVGIYYSIRIIKVTTMYESISSSRPQRRSTPYLPTSLTLPPYSTALLFLSLLPYPLPTSLGATPPDVASTGATTKMSPTLSTQAAQDPVANA